MANLATGLLGRFIPQSAGLSEEDRSAIARQGLLSVGLGLLGARNGGNFGASLADGLQSGLLAINRGVDNAGDQAYKRAMIANQMAGGSGMQEFNMLTKGLPDEDVVKSRRIKLGLDPRAVTAAARNGMLMGADNVERPFDYDPTTRRLRVLDNGQWVPADQSTNMPLSAGGVPATDASGTRINIGADVPPEIAAAIRADPNAGAYGTPQAPIQPVNPGLFQSAPKQVTAGQVAGAEANARNASDLAYLQPTLGLQTNAAIQRAGGEAAARGQVELQQANAQASNEKSRAANNILGLIQQAREYLPKAGEGFIDRTINKANQAVGRSTPQTQANQKLKIIGGQLTSAQPKMSGPQSDKDVMLYREMAGDVANENLPVQDRLAALDAIEQLQQKYATARPMSPYANEQSAPAAAGAPRRLKYNPATGKIE